MAKHVWGCSIKGNAARMARCKVYEIQGGDVARTAGAVRCHRDALHKIAVGGKAYPVCKKHSGRRWQLFKKDGWPYALDSDKARPA